MNQKTDVSQRILALFPMAVAVALPLAVGWRGIELGLVKSTLLVVLVYLGGALGLILAIRAGKLEIRSSLLNVAVVVFLLAAVLSTVLSPHTLLAVRALWKLGLLALLYMLAAHSIGRADRVVSFAAVACAGAVAVCVYGLGQHFGFDPLAWKWEGPPRVWSTLGNPSLLAGYLLFILPLSMALVFCSDSKAVRIFGLLAAGLSLYCLFLTRSKGAWLAFLVSFAVGGFFILRAKGRNAGDVSPWRKNATAVLGAMTLLILLLTLIPATKFFLSTFDSSLSVRKDLWKGAAGMFLDHPVIGTGIGSFQVEFPRYRPPDFRAAGVSYNTLHAHNEYLETLAEQGIVGGAVLLFLMAAIGIVGFRALSRAPTGPGWWITWAVFVGLIATFAHDLTNVTHRFNTVPAFFWIFAGILAGLDRPNPEGKRPVRGFSLKGWRAVVAAILLVLVTVLFALPMIGGPLSAGRELAQGKRFEKQGEWEQAAAAFASAAFYDQLAFEALYRAGRAQLMSGNVPGAISAYLALEKVAPDYAQLQLNLGMLYGVEDQWGKATVALLRASRSGTVDAPFLVGPTLKKLAAKPEFADVYEEILDNMTRNDPKNAVVWHMLGVLRLKQEAPDEAQDFFEQALFLDPYYTPSRSMLALIKSATASD